MAARDTLETMLNDLATTLGNLVKEKDCPAAILNVARQMLKDNGIEARAAKDSPLGNLADRLPVFGDEDGAEPLPN